jgi:N utilization substance protein B
MGFRRKGREHALQILFQLDITGNDPEVAIPLFWKRREALESVKMFAEKIVLGVVQNSAKLDSIISSSAEHWRLNRMAIVDRNVLRMALYEFLWELETPLVVIIDEAIEIGKKYGSEESGAFINGILDAVKKKMETGQIESQRIKSASAGD